MSQSLENARELFKIESLEKNSSSYVLRPDHTRTWSKGISPYFVKDLSINSYGYVFRKGPLGPLRFREFCQYDVDYVYEDFKLRPLLKWLNFTREFTTIINDTQLIKKYKDLNLQNNFESYKKEFYNKYPELESIKNVILKPDFKNHNIIHDSLIINSH